MINDPGKNLISCPVVQGWFSIKELTHNNYFLSTASNLLFNCGYSSSQCESRIHFWTSIWWLFQRITECESWKETYRQHNSTSSFLGIQTGPRLKALTHTILQAHGHAVSDERLTTAEGKSLGPHWELAPWEFRGNKWKQVSVKPFRTTQMQHSLMSGLFKCPSRMKPVVLIWTTCIHLSYSFLRSAWLPVT